MCSHVYQMCKNQFYMRMTAGCCQGESNSSYVNTENVVMFMNRQCIHTRHELYLDAEGCSLWAGRLSGGGGLCSGLEQSFEDGLGVHFWGWLRRGSLTSGARQGRGQTIFLCTATCAWSVTEPPAGAKKRKRCHNSTTLMTLTKWQSYQKKGSYLAIWQCLSA